MIGHALPPGTAPGSSSMPKRSSFRRLAVLAIAGLSAGAYLWQRGKRRRAGHSSDRDSWPRQVRRFVRLLQDRGSTLVQVRRVESATTPSWVVEWDHGRSLVFPDESHSDELHATDPTG
jgi:hypothetical protein